MKTNTIRTLIVLFLLAGSVTLFACAGGEQTITGTVEKTAEGHLLKASDGGATYRLVANKDFSAMEGKNVAITGTLLEREAGKFISVTRFEVVGAGDVSKTGEAPKN